jgi:alkylation response protein AidB-like acyl-CoA dehydrogenase
MQLELTDDQQFFRDTTARFLDEQAPVAELRRLRDDPVGFDEKYWHRGADLGWTSLLVPEDAGGGSISGNGVIDFSLIAYEFGRHAAPGPLVPTNVVAAALATAGAAHAEALARLLSGDAVASWCYGEPAARAGLGTLALDIQLDGDEVVLNGIKRPAESATHAQYLLVTGRTGTGVTQVLVPGATPGVSVSPLKSVDLTRRFAEVAFDQVRLPATAVVGGVGEAAGLVERQLQLALAATCAETVGAMQAGFDMTVDWARDRYSFGRPLNSYQALKHRFADMKSWLEASHAISDAAAAAVGTGSPQARELVSVAKAYVGDFGAELLQDCVQLHGGIGLTYEHDLHLFLRRATLDRALFGTPAEHRRRLADELEREEVA